MTWLHFYFPFLFVLCLFFLEGLQQRKGDSDADKMIHTVLFHHSANIIIIHIEIVYTKPFRIEQLFFLYFFSRGEREKEKGYLLYILWDQVQLTIKCSSNRELPKIGSRNRGSSRFQKHFILNCT